MNPGSGKPQQLPYRMLAAVVPSRGGWLVLPGRLVGATLAPMTPTVFGRFRDVLDWKPSFEIIALHLPVGLPSLASAEGRACDREARRLLGWPRALAVMSPPSRVALHANSLDEARELNSGLSPMAWQLVPKIAEAADELASYNQRVVHEIHPELSFYEMNAAHPLRHSKHRLPGREEREALLRTNMQNIGGVLDTPMRGPTRAKILDACAGLWTARRIAARGAAQRLPEDPEWDDEGLRMEIWR